MSSMAGQTAIPARHWSETLIARVLHPIQEFIHDSASSGIVLMRATILAPAA
jgi:hypothetical protein